MLRDVKWNGRNDPLLELVDPRQPFRVQQGVYSGGLNMDHRMVDGQIMEDTSRWPELNGTPEENRAAVDAYLARINLSPYGVADSVEQILAHHADLVNDPGQDFVLLVTTITQASQPDRGGWRWHKWGEYIGTHEVKYEYLYDQPEIEEVLVYHIYPLHAEETA